MCVGCRSIGVCSKDSSVAICGLKLVAAGSGALSDRLPDRRLTNLSDHEVFGPEDGLVEKGNEKFGGILSRSQAADTFNLNNEILAQHVLKRVVTHLTADRVNLKDLDFLTSVDADGYRSIFNFCGGKMQKRYPPDLRVELKTFAHQRGRFTQKLSQYWASIRAIGPPCIHTML